MPDRRKIEEDIEFFKNCVDLDAFDALFFNEIKEESDNIRVVIDSGAEDYEHWPELGQDLFSALYKYRPQIREDSEILLSKILNKKIIQQIVESQKYKELRSLTRLDKVNATIGTEIMCEKVEEYLKELKEQQKALEELLEAADQVAEAEQGEQNTPEPGVGKETTHDQKMGPSEESLTLKEAKRKLEEAQQSFNDKFKKQESKSKIDTMIESVIDQTTETTNMITSWGLDQAGDFTKTSYQEKLRMLKKIRSSHKLKSIAELAGRYRDLATKTQWEKVKTGTNEVYNIEQGDKLNRAIPSELLKLRNPLTKTLFKKDLLEKSILQYSLKGKSKKGKGPIVVCIDESGSMAGMPEIWSKAVALGLLEVARSQKRSLVAIHFDSTSNSEFLHREVFRKNEPYETSQIISLAEHFCGGGTMFEPALNLSRQYIDEDKDFEKADIIFITDGECVVRDKWLKSFVEWKNGKKVKVTSILIDSYYNTGRSIKEFSDEVVRLKDIKSDKAEKIAISLFTSV